MQKKKKIHPSEKSNLHPRNKHRERYDFRQLIKSLPELEIFVKRNEYNDESINFFNPQAVLHLNKALLKHFYGIQHWNLPSGYLCPPIPGRADYIHYVADLLNTQNTIPSGDKIRCLDIGVGANCIYPIIAVVEYGWNMVGTDIDLLAIDAAKNIINNNVVLKDKIELRHQTNTAAIFDGIINSEEYFDVTICNPPFHSSLKEATNGTLRKLANLKQRKITNPLLNFGGQQHELSYEGGEELFVKRMIQQSKLIEKKCCWFTTLISKSTHLEAVYHEISKVKAALIIMPII